MDRWRGSSDLLQSFQAKSVVLSIWPSEACRHTYPAAYAYEFPTVSFLSSMGFWMATRRWSAKSLNRRWFRTNMVTSIRLVAVCDGIPKDDFECFSTTDTICLSISGPYDV